MNNCKNPIENFINDFIGDFNFVDFKNLNGIKQTDYYHTLNFNTYNEVDKTVLMVEVPGFTEKQVHVSIDNEKSFLIIEIDKSDSKYKNNLKEIVDSNEEKMVYTWKFKKSYNLDKIKVSLSNGVLKIDLPFKKESIIKKIF